ncbi:hypothetical protein [Pseudomonas tremae]|uniref:TRAFAC clade GTPase domain-containing protein n=1 Tax=Pseudomonas tremae TaxID=200454 RepID=UPI001F1DA04A|nr:hypothetical protein [Pseudomonas tremae]MCF5806245.1 hypothetical protein [Pseudomonas tremae]MCF5811346.1 hypothetical protein [Pseudomonas tremae]
MNRSIVLIGGPDSGKTNYIGPLWRALDLGSGALRAAEQPDDINFVLEITDHLYSGAFAPRTEHSDARRDFEVVVEAGAEGPQARIVVPDISGELWRNAVIESEIDSEWMSELTRADGALLFVRVGSDQDVRPLDWVTSRRMLERMGAEDQGLPTQVMLCELIRFLEVALIERQDGELPRLSVVVAAWDLVDDGLFKLGPMAFLQREYPLFAGRLLDLEALHVRVFGLSSVGGDLKYDADFRQAYLQEGPDGRGWVAIEREGGWVKDSDITLPIAWAVGL